MESEKYTVSSVMIKDGSTRHDETRPARMLAHSSTCK